MSCKPHNTCSAGQYSSVAPTPTSARVCASCIAGTFQGSSPFTGTSCTTCSSSTYQDSTGHAGKRRAASTVLRRANGHGVEAHIYIYILAFVFSCVFQQPSSYLPCCVCSLNMAFDVALYHSLFLFGPFASLLTAFFTFAFLPAFQLASHAVVPTIATLLHSRRSAKQATVVQDPAPTMRVMPAASRIRRDRLVAKAGM